MLRANRDWIETTTFARAVDGSLPLGKVYLPDSSYREMTEWALPPEALRAYRRGVGRLAAPGRRGRNQAVLSAPAATGAISRRGIPRATRCTPGCSAYRGASTAAWQDPNADPDYLEIARQELYRGQCNCPYWHGSFGGLYLPHLRNAIYHALIAAHNALDDAEERTGPRALIEVGDFNLDARQEVRLENDRLIAWVRPGAGATSTSWTYAKTVRTFWRHSIAVPRPTTKTILAAAAARGGGHERARGKIQTASGEITFKQRGLDQLLVYDRYPRKALVDHFYPVDVSLDDLVAGRDVELGDFVLGTYLAKVQREPSRVAVVMERPGLRRRPPDPDQEDDRAFGRQPGLSIHYELEELPADVCLHFARGDQSGGDGRPRSRPLLLRHGRHQARHARRAARLAAHSWPDADRPVARPLGRPHLVASGRPLVLPDRTVSQSEGGIEGVYQSSAIIPHWHVTADEHGRWEFVCTGPATGFPSQIQRKSRRAPGRRRVCLANPRHRSRAGPKLVETGSSSFLLHIFACPSVWPSRILCS